MQRGVESGSGRNRIIRRSRPSLRHDRTRKTRTKPTLVLFAFAHAASLRACGGPYAATQLKSRKRPFASFYFVARGVGCSGQSPAFSSHPKTQSLRKGRLMYKSVHYDQNCRPRLSLFARRWGQGQCGQTTCDPLPLLLSGTHNQKQRLCSSLNTPDAWQSTDSGPVVTKNSRLI